MVFALFALEAWSTMVIVAVAQQEKLPKDPYVLVNAKMMNFLIEMETATLVVPMKPFPMANALVKLDTLEIHVEFALSHAHLVNSSSKDHVLAAHLIPFTTLQSTDAHAPMVSIWIPMAFVKNSPSSQSHALMDNTSILIMDVLLAVLNAKLAEDQINASPAIKMDSQPTHKDFVFPLVAMELSLLLKPAILEKAHQMDALDAELSLDMLAMDNHQSADLLPPNQLPQSFLQL